MESSSTCLVCEKPAIRDFTYLRDPEMRRMVVLSKVRMDSKHVKFETALRKQGHYRIHGQCFESYSSWKDAIIARNEVERQLISGTIEEPQNFPYKDQCIFGCDNEASDEYINGKWMKNKAKYPRVFKYDDIEKIIQLKEDVKNNDTQKYAQLMSRFEFLESQSSPHMRFHNHCRNFQTVVKVRGPDIDYVNTIPNRIYKIGKYVFEREEVNQFNLTKIFADFNLDGKRTELRDHLKIFFEDSMIYHGKMHRSGLTILSRKEIVHEALNSYWEGNTSFVKKVADGIVDEIESLKVDTNNYPNPGNFLSGIDDMIPPTLKSLLELVIDHNRHGYISEDEKRLKLRKQKKVSALCHAIVSCAKPSIISPLMLGLGILIYRKYGSSDLIKILSSLGFCCSYYNARNLVTSIAGCSDGPTFTNSYVQLVFDNADHNTATIDGKNTFHCMGGIEIVTPYNSVSFDHPIPKLKNLEGTSASQDHGFMKLVQCDPPNCKALESIRAINLLDGDAGDMSISVTEGDFFWLFAKHATNFEFKGYKAFLHDLCGNKLCERSRVIPLPFVNHPPTDRQTILTVLSRSQEICTQFKQKKIFLTFDQSLYIKARAIVAQYSNQSDQDIGDENNDENDDDTGDGNNAERKTKLKIDKLIIRLGGFHLQMSFMGCIGYIMGGSGIKTILSEIYAPNSIDKILDGHHYSRAMRAYVLLNAAVADNLFKKMQASDYRLTDSEREFMNGKVDYNSDTLGETLINNKFIRIQKKFSDFIDEVEKRGPTAKLWVQFFKMTTLLKQFDQAEKDGDWALHLLTIRKMIPFFHAAGHNNYAESAHLYLQDVLSLEKVLSQDEYAKFITAGFFTVRQSGKHACGTYSDQTIEQQLMKGIKVKGGFVRRGITEPVVTAWIGSNVALLDIINSLTEYCAVDLSTSEQHPEDRDSRIETDRKHLLKLRAFFDINDPFPYHPYVLSLHTGAIGNSTINCHLAQEVGIELLRGVTNKYFGQLSLKRKTKVLPLSAMSSFTINDERIAVDANDVFRRIVFSKNEINLEDYLDYELAAFPASIFDGIGFHKTEKSKLYSCFKPLEDCIIPPNAITVIDGGFLLHRVVWKATDTFQMIIEKYRNYLQHYKQCVVVFDGYPPDNSTKSFERARRAKKRYSPSMLFLAGEQECGVSQEDFLSNEDNKKLLISALTEHFQRANINVFQAQEDADIHIVMKAIDEAKKGSFVQIIAEDIDVLVLLTQFYEGLDIVFTKMNRGRSSNDIYNVNSFKYPHLKKIIAFLHAFSGCDTNCAFYQKGKETIFKSIAEDKDLIDRAQIFYKPEVNKDDLWKVALDIVSTVYVRKTVPVDNFNAIRVQCYANMKTDINIRRLPPTDLAIREHALRVYLQCQDWCLNILNPTDWGWKLVGNKLVPIFTTKPLLPDKFLKKFTCSCKTGCTRKCSCKKVGLRCTKFCKACRGTDCDNSENVLTIQDFDKDEDLEEEIQLELEPEILIQETENLWDTSDFCDSQISSEVDWDETTTEFDEDEEISSRKIPRLDFNTTV